MEKRALLAIGLSFVILLGWNFLFPPDRTSAPPPVEVSIDSGSQATPTTAPPAVTEEALAGPEGPTEGAGGDEEASVPVAASEQRTIEINNGPMEITLTNQGGRALSWRLRDYINSQNEPLNIFPQYVDNAELPLSIDVDNAALSDDLNAALYEVERETVSSSDGSNEGERIRFTWSDGRGVVATKSFTFWREEWLVDVEVDVRDRGRRLPARIVIGPGFGAAESRTGKSTYYYAGQGVWNLGGEITRRKPKKLAKEDGGVSGSLRWAGLEDQYFAGLVLPGSAPAQARWSALELTPVRLPGDDLEKEAEAVREPLLAVDVSEAGAKLFIGPKNYTLLHNLGFELERAVWFASNPFLATISKYIFLALLWIYAHVAPNYGLAIVLATFCLRMLLFPVNQYSMVSMKKAQLQMQRLQPKIKAIKAKYGKKKDAQSRAKMNQETMDLYKREGVNPAGGLAGCLPMLAQFPILIGFYNMLTVAIELRGAPFFGWIQDLSQKDPFYVTPILMAGTMFIQQKLAMSKVKDPMQQQQQKMMMFMPFVFGWICINMPAGLVLYWFVNNILGIAQQWLVNRHTVRLEAAHAQKV